MQLKHANNPAQVNSCCLCIITCKMAVDVTKAYLTADVNTFNFRAVIPERNNELKLSNHYTRNADILLFCYNTKQCNNTLLSRGREVCAHRSNKKTLGNTIVTPIHKKSLKSDPANCRPISLTCILCKVMEHIIVSNM